MKKIINSEIITVIIILLFVITLTVYKVVTEVDFEKIKLYQKTDKEIAQKYNLLSNLYEYNFEEVFEISDQIIRINNIKYQEINNYNKIINENFTELGETKLIKDLDDSILKDNDKVYLKLKSNKNKEFVENKYYRVEVFNDKVLYNIKTKLKINSQNKITENNLSLIKIENNWLIDEYNINFK